MLAAVYFFALPVDNVVLYSEEPTNPPQRYSGDLRSFFLFQANDRPAIPLDAHNVICLNWAQAHEVIRNMDYLSEEIRAAVALVS